jgi:hypothetical protein
MLGNDADGINAAGRQFEGGPYRLPSSKFVAGGTGE